LGWLRYERQEFTKSSFDFDKACEFNPSDDYAHFGAWLCGSRLGETASATDDLKRYLAARQFKNSDDWPAKIGDFLIGQITEQELLAAAENVDDKQDREHHCEAYFYIGSKRLITGDKAGAVACFEKCLATGVQDFNEYQSAKAELRNLEDAN
jgi:lipoprotein NlpI